EDGAVGGGIFNEDGGVITMVNATVAGNVGGYSGGGIENYGIVEAYNSIIAKNYASFGADVYTVAGHGNTRVYTTIIGDESRNKRLDAYNNGVNSKDPYENSIIGTSAGSTVSSPVTTYDPGFVSYRDYSADDWSPELWKYWNLRLVGDSLAVNLGVNDNFSSSKDFGLRLREYNPVPDYWLVQAYRYSEMGNTRFDTGFPGDLAGQERIGDDRIDAGAYELLGKSDLTQFVPTSAGADVVNNWENSIVVSRAIDDQTGSVAPFLVDEQLYLNLAIINQGPEIKSNFETTVYLWKYMPGTSKETMFADSKQSTGVPIMNIKVEFPTDAAMPGGTANATITCTNLATGEVQTLEYDGSTSYMLIENVALGSVENIVRALIDNGDMTVENDNEEGYYVFGYAIDTNETENIDEYSETNNFFLTTSYFDVVESPVSINDSIVVTTTDDEVNPYDGLISLREAVEVYAGSFYYAEVALQDGDTFEANGVTYKVQDGKFYVDVSTAYQVYPGEQFTVKEDGSVISYVVDEFFNGENKVVAVSEGDAAIVNGLECVLSDGVWTNVKETARYTRDDVQAQGSFTMADGSVVTVVNGVFRRDLTDDVAIVPDGSVVTLANGETATYDFAQDRFIVTETTTFTLGDGDTIVYGGETLTLVSDAYVDETNTRYKLESGTVVLLSNGYEVTYDGEKFVYNYPAVSETKLPAGTTVTLNGEEYTYKAGRALVKKVSRESNAVVFSSADPNLDGATFELTKGPLTIDKTFTLDCVDPDGNQLDLTITSTSDDPCLFYITGSADVTVKNFKFKEATSTEDGAIFENEGKLTLETLTFKDTVAENGSLVYNASGATLNVNAVAFENNKANAKSLIYNEGVANIGSGTTFDGDYGFLSPIYSKGVLTVDGAKFTSTSGENGGAILNDGGIAVIARSEFKGTSAKDKGGAIYNAGGKSELSVYDTTFDGTVAVNGGAIYNGSAAKLTVEASIYKNAQATENGGAIYNDAGTFTDKGSTFENNTATLAGGAIYDLGTATLAGSTFQGNSAAAGGAIYGASDSDVKIIGGTFFGNSATNGAGVYAAGEFLASNSLFAKTWRPVLAARFTRPRTRRSSTLRSPTTKRPTAQVCITRARRFLKIRSSLRTRRTRRTRRPEPVTICIPKTLKRRRRCAIRWLRISRKSARKVTLRNRRTVRSLASIPNSTTTIR
ncbi:MAG: hypothetical protein J6X44_11465, partial [Thermoguttaceae bacterium]|nr:hypothetical protein [Thermoguttaceae bacterium]